jgi:hypothetical protein
MRFLDELSVWVVIISVLAGSIVYFYLMYVLLSVEPCEHI